ncbi:putative uncharacterized protein DDB_G0282133 isoform X2 [Aphidius gifuensis]|nr:putative uncharacterized protein DDB_G0282133 isoform X2 [Aphidius gifuensis]
MTIKSLGMEDKRMTEMMSNQMTISHQMKNNIENVCPSSPGVQSMPSGARRRSGPQILLRSPAAKRPLSAPVALQGWLYKRGSEGLMLWKRRWFVLTEYCLFYYKTPEEKNLLGSILLPSYCVSICTQDDKTNKKKYAFKAEHLNMRTYYFAAETHDSMLQWINSLTLATLVQDPNTNYKITTPVSSNTSNFNDNCDGEQSARPSVSSISSMMNQSADDSDSGFHGFLSRDEQILSNNNSTPNSGNTLSYPNSSCIPNTTNNNINNNCKRNIINNNSNNNNGQLQSQFINNGWQQRHYHNPNMMHNMYGCTRQQQQQQHQQQQQFNVQNIETMPRKFGQPVYANAPPKPRRLTDGSTEYSTPSPDPDDNTPQTYQQQHQQQQQVAWNMIGANQKSPDQDDNTPQLLQQQKAGWNMIGVKQKSPDYDGNSIIYGTRINQINQQSVVPLRTDKSGLNYMNNQVQSNNERRTPDTYGRSTKTNSRKTRINGSDYEDVYAGPQLYQRPIGPVGYCKSPVPLPIDIPSPIIDNNESIYVQQQQKIIDQPPRPHSADFLEHDMIKRRNNNNTSNKKIDDNNKVLHKRHQRPKSSMDIIPIPSNINDYYTEEKYAAQMRQTYLKSPQSINGTIDSVDHQLYSSHINNSNNYHSHHKLQRNNSRTTTPSLLTKKYENYNNENNYDCHNIYGIKDNKITASSTTQSLKRHPDNFYNSGMMRRSLREKNYDNSFNDSSYIDTNNDGTILTRIRLNDSNNYDDGNDIYGLQSRQVGEHLNRRRLHDQQFMRSASARLPRNRHSNTIQVDCKNSADIDADDCYEQGLKSPGSRDGDRRIQQREESMKRLLEWKQRMLQSPLTKKPTSQITSNSPIVKTELSSHYKRQALLDLAAHEASVAEARQPRHPRRDDNSSHRSHLRSKSSDGCRSANNIIRYNSYSSDDEEPDDDVKRKRTRRQSSHQTSGKTNRNDDKTILNSNKCNKNITSPDVGYCGYEDTEFPVSPVSQYHDTSINLNDSINNEKDQSENTIIEKKSSILKTKNYQYNIDEDNNYECDLSSMIKKNLTLRRGKAIWPHSTPSPTSSLSSSSKTIQWNSPDNSKNHVDESQFIKEFSYQYIKADEDYLDDNKSLNDKSKSVSFKSDDQTCDTDNTDDNDQINDSISKESSQSIEVNISGGVGGSGKSVKDLLADYEKKSDQFVHKAENDKQDELKVEDITQDNFELSNKNNINCGLINSDDPSECYVRHSVADSMIANIGVTCNDELSSDNISINSSFKNDDKGSPEAHYLPMSPKKAILDPNNDVSNGASKIMSNLFQKLDHEECSYVEMTQRGRTSRCDDERYSVLAPNQINNYNKSMLDSGDYTTLDNSHYEFVCVTDNKIEPVYMEVCQLINKNNDHDHKNQQNKTSNDNIKKQNQRLSQLSADLPDILTTLKTNDNQNYNNSDNDRNNDADDNENNNDYCRDKKINKNDDNNCGEKKIIDNTDSSFNLSDKIMKNNNSGDVDDDDIDNCDDDNFLESSNYDGTINLPRHPRFSLSDTFRPASHYLDIGRNINLSEFSEDFQDNDLVSPPPIPTTTPPLDELDSLEIDDKIDEITAKNLEITSNLINLPKFKDSQNSIASGLQYDHDNSQEDEEARYRKLKRRPVSNDVCEIFDNLDELESLGSRFDGASIDLDQYLEELRIRDAFNVDLYSKDLSYNSLYGLNDNDNKFNNNKLNKSNLSTISSEISVANSTEYLSTNSPNTSVNINDNQPHPHHSHHHHHHHHHINNNTRTNSASSLPAMRITDLPQNHHQHSQSFSGCTTTDEITSLSAYYENVTNFSPLPTMTSDESFNLSYNQKLLNKCDKKNKKDDDNKTINDHRQLQNIPSQQEQQQQQDNDQIGAPYYYSDLQNGQQQNINENNNVQIKQPVLIAYTSRLPQLNNQRGNTIINYTNKRNDIGRLVNPITKQLPRTIQVDDIDEARLIAAELRKKSCEYLSNSANKICKSDMDDKKNFYESDTLRRFKCRTDDKIDLINNDDVNIYPHGLIRDKTMKLSDWDCVNYQPNHRRSRSLEGLLDNVDLQNLIANDSSRNNFRVSSVPPISQREIINDDNNNDTGNNTFSRINSNELTRPIDQQEDPWQEDSLWRDSLRRISHRHARSLDNLESRSTNDHSRERHKITRDAVYVNDSMRYVSPITVKDRDKERGGGCDDGVASSASGSGNNNNTNHDNDEDGDENKKENCHVNLSQVEQSTSTSINNNRQTNEDGAYECLEMNRSTGGYIWDPNSETYNKIQDNNNDDDDKKNHFLDVGNLPPKTHMKTQSSFEIDREKLRQWDLLSSACSHQEQRTLMGDVSVRGLPVLENQQEDGQNMTLITTTTTTPTMTTTTMTTTIINNQTNEDKDIDKIIDDARNEDETMEKNNGKASGSGSVIGRDPLPPRAISTSQLSQNNLTNQPRSSSQSHVNGHDSRVQQQMTSPLPVYQSTPQSATITKMRQNGNDIDSSICRGTTDVNNSTTMSSESLHNNSTNLRVISPIDYRISSPSDSERHTHNSSDKIPINYMNGSIGGNSYRQLHQVPQDSDIIDHQTYKRMMNMASTNQNHHQSYMIDKKTTGNLVQVSAGELLGRTHEELVLLLIQLRRQSASLCKAMEKCHMEIEAQARLVELDTPRRLENLHKLDELKNHLIDLEKQYEKGKPLVNLVDNMVKLGSLYNRNGINGNSSILNANPYEKNGHINNYPENNQRAREEKLLEEHRKRNQQTADQGKLQEKVKQLYKIDRLLQEETGTMYSLQQDKELLEKALGGLRNKLQDNRTNNVEFEKYKKQQNLLERELSRVRMLLSHNSKKLEETIIENTRLENELVILRQKIQESRGYSGGYSNTPGTTANLEFEFKRVQQLVCDLQRQRQDLSIQVHQLTEKSHNLVKQINPNPSTSPLTFTSIQTPGVHHIYQANKKRIPTSWFETDLDSGVTFDHGLVSPSSSTTSSSLSPMNYTNIHMTQLSPQLREQMHQQQIHKNQLLKDRIQGKSRSSPILTNIPLYVNTDGRKVIHTGLPPEYISPPPPPPPTLQSSSVHSHSHLQLSSTLSPPGSPLPPPPPPPPLIDDSMFNGTVNNNNRDKQQEIKTVRIVKRESERRQRDRDRGDNCRNNNIGIPLMNGHGISSGHDYDHIGMPRVDENQYYQQKDLVNNNNNNCNNNSSNNNSNNSNRQVEKSMSLPRGFGGQKNQQDIVTAPPVLPPPRSDSMNALKNIIARCSQTTKLDSGHDGINDNNTTINEQQNSLLPMSYQNYASPYTKLRKSQEMNLIQQCQQQSIKLSQEKLTNSVASVNSVGGESPQLSPVFKSEAAKQIIKEMTEKKIDKPKKRLIPKEKRRHYTVSSSKPIIGLEDVFSKMQMGRARDDLDMERALRPRINAPDVVRSTLSQKELKFNENMIDQLLGAPNKIFIPERYVPEQTPELSAEEKKQRLQKADAIRKMLSETTVTAADDANDDTVVNNEKSNDFKRKVAEEKKQRDHILQLNQILAKQVMEKSKMVAVTALIQPDKNYDDDDYNDLSPTQMPLYQQRDNYFY